MVKAVFYNGTMMEDGLNYQGSVAMDLPRITNQFMKNVLLTMRMVDEDKTVWCHLFVNDKYVGLIAYSGPLESYIFINHVSDGVYEVYRKRWESYDRKAG